MSALAKEAPYSPSKFLVASLIICPLPRLYHSQVTALTMATKHPSRTGPRDSVTCLWRGLGLPEWSLEALDLPEGDENVLSSSFKVARKPSSTHL